MKTLTSILTVTIFVTHVCGYLIQVPTTPVLQPRITVPTQWIPLQKLINPLFENVCEVSSDPVVKKLAEEFTISLDDYQDQDAIIQLQNLMANGLTPKGEIFTEYNPAHMTELKMMYEVLYYANDFNVFYKAAAWMRQNVNCALYLSAIYIALLKRKDTERLSIPAPYELIPNYFIGKDVITTASSVVSGQTLTSNMGVHEDGSGYTLDANYTAMFYDNDDDSKLAYFREDIGLNSFYFFKKLSLAPWFNSNVNGNYGERMYQQMKQLMSRYNLERHANGFSETESINWDSLPDINYDSMLIYSNGNEFTSRMSSLNFPLNEDVALLKTIENNVVTVVSHMIQSGYNKTQILNHLMEILVTGERSYETLARKLLGNDLINNGYPSVMDHYMTSLRDPMFWIINKKVVEMIDNALEQLPPYTKSELYFPGVQVENIEVKKMMTACDYFEFDVTDALKIDNAESVFKIKIGQPRLNHKPFSIRVNVSSLVSQKGLVKIFLGPKLMPGELVSKKNLFTLLDSFEVNLKLGTNIISRNSGDMQQFADDFMSLPMIRKKTEDAEFGLNSLPFKTIASQTAYPSRLILPKGTPQGLPLQMFVFIAPLSKASLSDSYLTNSMEFNTATLSPGYPLDLKIEDRLFDLPNALVKYIMITQKSDSKIENYGSPGTMKTWYGTSETNYDPSLRPNYPGRPIDYIRNGGDDVYDEVKDNGHNFAINSKDYKNDLTVIPQYLSSQKNVLKYKNKNKYDYKFQNGDINNKKPQGETDLPNIQSFDSKETVTTTEKTAENNKLLLKYLTYDFSSGKQIPFSELYDYKTQKKQFEKSFVSKKTDKRNDFIKSKDDIIITSTVKNVDFEDTIDTTQVADSDNMNETDDLQTNLLKSSITTFDYKAKKAEYSKKNYAKYRTKAPMEEVTTLPTYVLSHLKDDVEKIVIDKGNDPEVKVNIEEVITFPDTALTNDPKDEVEKIIIINKQDDSVDDIHIEEVTTFATTKTANDPTDEVEKNIYINKKYDSMDENKEKNIRITDIIKPAYNMINSNTSVKDVRVPSESVPRKQTTTIYDILFHGFDYDDSNDSKIYE